MCEDVTAPHVHAPDFLLSGKLFLPTALHGMRYCAGHLDSNTVRLPRPTPDLASFSHRPCTGALTHLV